MLQIRDLLAKHASQQARRTLKNTLKISLYMVYKKTYITLIVKLGANLRQNIVFLHKNCS